MLLRAIVTLIRSLLVLVALAVVGWSAAQLLLATSGPPRLPERWPSPTELSLGLQVGVDNSVVLYLAGQLGWLLLGYIAIVVLLDALLTIAETIMASLRGVATLRQLTNGLAPTPLRGALSNVILAAFALRLALGGPAPAAARTLEPVTTVQTAQGTAQPGPPGRLVTVTDHGFTAPEAEPAMRAVTGQVWHTVRAGETLSHLALSYYGDATAWRPIWEANRGQVMPSGRYFDHYGQLLPGDRLVIPPQADARPTQLVVHVVQPGDTLSRISQHYHGTSARLDEIFEDNRGVPAPNGQYLQDKNRIWPGMRLLIRQSAPPAAPAAPPIAEAAPAAPDHPPAVEPPATVPPATTEPPVATGQPATPPTTPEPAEPVVMVTATPAPPAGSPAVATAVGVPVTPAPTMLPINATEPTPAVTPTVSLPTAEPPTAPLVAVAEPDAESEPAGQESGSLDAATLSLISAALTATALGGLAYRRYRRRSQAPLDTADPHLSPLQVLVQIAVDRLSGFARRSLTGQAQQRLTVGIETDARVAPTGQLLATLAAIGWPEAVISCLLEQGPLLRYTLRLGAPANATVAHQALDQLLTALSERLATSVEGEPGADGWLELRLPARHPDQLWTTENLPPSAPLLHIGQAGTGLLSVSPEGLGSGLLLAGEGAPTALESLLLSAVALYPADRLRLILITDSPLAETLRVLPHLVQAPVAATTPAAQELLLAVHDELRHRQLMPSAERADLVLLVIDQPIVLDSPELRDLLVNGAAYGLYTLLLMATNEQIDQRLADLCAGRLIGRLASAALSLALAGQAGAEELSSGAAWWVLDGQAPETVALLAVEPDDRVDLLTLLGTGNEQPVPLFIPRPLEPDPSLLEAPAMEPGADEASGAEPETITAVGSDHSPTVTGTVDDRSVPVTPIVDEAEPITETSRAPESEPIITMGLDTEAEPIIKVISLDDDAAVVEVIGEDEDDTVVPTELDERSTLVVPAIVERPAASVHLRLAVESGPTTTPHTAAPALPLTPPPGCLEIRLFGAARLGRSGALKEISRPKVAELLAFLVRHPGGVSKEEIGNTLWPDASDCDKQIESLYKTKNRLADILTEQLSPDAEPPIIGRHPLNSPYRLQIADLWSDVAALTGALDEARRRQDDDEAGALALIRAALPLYTGRLCGSSTSAWLDMTNDEIAAQVGLALARLAAAEARAQRYPAAIELYRHLRQLAILLESERVFRDELLCHALLQDRTGLQQAYRQFSAWLEREYEIEPEAKTTALYRHLLASPERPTIDLNRHFVLVRL